MRLTFHIWRWRSSWATVTQHPESVWSTQRRCFRCPDIHILEIKKLNFHFLKIQIVNCFATGERGRCAAVDNEAAPRSSQGFLLSDEVQAGFHYISTQKMGFRNFMTKFGSFKAKSSRMLFLDTFGASCRPHRRIRCRSRLRRRWTPAPCSTLATARAAPHRAQTQRGGRRRRAWAQTRSISRYSAPATSSPGHWRRWVWNPRRPTGQKRATPRVAWAASLPLARSSRAFRWASISDVNRNTFVSDNYWRLLRKRRYNSPWSWIYKQASEIYLYCCCLIPT